MYKRDVCQIDKEFLKGCLQECVVDKNGTVVAITGDNAPLAEFIAAMLGLAEKSPVDLVELLRNRPAANLLGKWMEANGAGNLFIS